MDVNSKQQTINTAHILPSIGNFNGRSFSVVTFSNDWNFQYDILELEYQLSVKVLWFAFYSRRRENENVSIMCSDITIQIPESDIKKIPYFKKKFAFNGKEEEITHNRVLNEFSNEPELLKAFVFRYQNEIGNRLYSNDSEVKTHWDRFSSLEELEKNFSMRYAPNSDLSNIKGKLKSCII